MNDTRLDIYLEKYRQKLRSIKVFTLMKNQNRQKEKKKMV